MTDNFEFKGTFYLPGKKANAIHGTLFYDLDEGLTLDLMGSLARGQDRGILLIHGELEDGKAVTLFNSFQIFGSFASGGMRYAKYASNYLFLGDVLFTSETDISFNKVTVHFSHIEDWLNIQTGFKKIDLVPEEGRVSIEYELPQAIKIPISSDKSITLNFTVRPPAKYQMVRTSVSIAQRADIVFTYRRKTKLSQVFDDTFQFQNFLTICLQRPAFVKQIRGFLRIKNAKQLYEVEIFFTQGIKREEEKQLLPMDTLVSFKRIEGIFPTVLKSWYDNSLKLRPTEDPYFSSYHSRQYFISDRFLNLARSLEAFHRDTVAPTAAYRTRLMSLQKKYSKLYNHLLKIRSQAEFAGKIVKLRNDFTHSNPITRRDNDRFIKVHYLCENMQIMLSCMLLNYHGIPDKTIIDGIKNSRLYTHIRMKRGFKK